ncbi:hypothetical protein GH714_027275 [Hevea brasiliensis]|uniref:Anthocyanidin 3-O-glucosyltransferase n=1 Tax=Hevea brasiliensis TaxID=3981 RepID=A0A6A6N2M5_HEVBR|nr:hypothetical protein GH714_027275 [Hevea brasiliensis]
MEGDSECIKWLDSQEPGSVVYVNFGSIAVMTPFKLAEFAWGLANSNKPFLWIARPDLVTGDSVVLSSEFVAETKERGIFLAEQQTNCWFACNKWGIGMEINNDAKRDEVENLVRKLMEGEEGKEMKKSVMKLKEKAEEATRPGGSSYQNFQKLLAVLANKQIN